MTRWGHRLFTLILVWTFAAGPLRSTAFAEPNDAGRILILNVVNKAGIPMPSKRSLHTALRAQFDRHTTALPTSTSAGA